ncbi:MAG: sxtJ [Gammaproteobacteria bacterium]|nr:sxtJ [Gammaproteobacteria bacterium]
MAGDLKSIPTLDKKGYREFGLVTGAIVVGLFGLAIPFLFGWNYPTWPWIIFGVLAAMALIVPMALKPVYKYWMMFGLFMGTYIMTPLIMFIVFFGMFMPFGLVMRLFGKDGMNRKLDAEAKTYRVVSDQPPAKNLEKPY